MCPLVTLTIQQVIELASDADARTKFFHADPTTGPTLQDRLNVAHITVDAARMYHAQRKEELNQTRTWSDIAIERWEDDQK